VFILFYVEVKNDGFVKSRIQQNGIIKNQRVIIAKKQNFGLFTIASKIKERKCNFISTLTTVFLFFYYYIYKKINPVKINIYPFPPNLC